jgi:hypothetical protein
VRRDFILRTCGAAAEPVTRSHVRAGQKAWEDMIILHDEEPIHQMDIFPAPQLAWQHEGLVQDILTEPKQAA